MKTEVYCTLRVEGSHYWGDCPFPEVMYLRSPHRHLFHIKAYKEVTHADRDIEFIMLKHSVRGYLQKKYYTGIGDPNFSQHLHVFGSMSCEMIAEELINEFGLSRCEVNEDGENGAIVTCG